MTIGHQSGSQPLRFFLLIYVLIKIIFSGTFRLIYLKDSVVVGFGHLLVTRPHHTICSLLLYMTDTNQNTNESENDLFYSDVVVFVSIMLSCFYLL